MLSFLFLLVRWLKWLLVEMLPKFFGRNIAQFFGWNVAQVFWLKCCLRFLIEMLLKFFGWNVAQVFRLAWQVVATAGTEEGLAILRQAGATAYCHREEGECDVDKI